MRKEGDYYLTKDGKCCIACFYGFHGKSYSECACACHEIPKEQLPRVLKQLREDLA